MAESLSRPPKAAHHFHRVAILFAGGPAPGANAVISTAATSFLANEPRVSVGHQLEACLDTA